MVCENKYSEQDLFKRVDELNWEIDFIDRVGLGEYEKGDIFNLTASSREEFESVTLKKKSTGKTIDIPYFLCIKPTWFVREDALYVVFVAGNKPAELERVVMWFDCFNSKEPRFEYSIEPLFDEGQITDNEAHNVVTESKDQKPDYSFSVLALRSNSAGSRGGGRGHTV